MSSTLPLFTSLRQLIAAIPAGRDDWCLIGSAAAFLSGIDLQPDDIDVVGTKATIEALHANLGKGTSTLASEDSKLFHSMPFVRVQVEGGRPIELMGDLKICIDGAWQHLVITTRQRVITPAGILYVPSLKEQVSIFERFGRPKDLQKADLLRRYL